MDESIRIISTSKKSDYNDVKFTIEIPSMDIDYVGHAMVTSSEYCDFSIETKDQVDEIPKNKSTFSLVEQLVSRLLEEKLDATIKNKKGSVVFKSGTYIHLENFSTKVMLLALNIADMVPIINMVAAGEISVDEAVENKDEYGFFGGELDAFFAENEGDN